MKSYKDKRLLFSLVFLGLCAGFGGRLMEGVHLSLPQNTASLNQATALFATQQNLTLKTPLPPDITLGFAGTIHFDTKVKNQVAKNLDGDDSQLFANVGFLTTPDIAFANLDNSVSEENLVPALKNAGVDVVSFNVIDTNESTLAQLRTNDIQYCGPEEPAIFAKDGFTVGFICFSDESGPLTTINQIVKDTSSKVDSLIVSFNFDTKKSKTTEAGQEELATEAVDNGAAMVIGVHPETTANMATYKDAPILTGLGNFISSQSVTKGKPNGFYVTATLNGKTVSKVTSHQIVLDKNFAPSLLQ